MLTDVSFLVEEKMVPLAHKSNDFKTVFIVPFLANENALSVCPGQEANVIGIFGACSVFNGLLR